MTSISTLGDHADNYYVVYCFLDISWEIIAIIAYNMIYDYVRTLSKEQMFVYVYSISVVYGMYSHEKLFPLWLLWTTCKYASMYKDCSANGSWFPFFAVERYIS